jgi:Uma2 family endonuclease
LGIVEEKRLVGAPDLVVEITSPGTAAYDRDADIGKRGAYARAGVPEYWLADPLTRTVEVLVLEDEAYATLGVAHGDESIPSRVLPDASIPARSCFPR